MLGLLLGTVDGSAEGTSVSVGDDGDLLILGTKDGNNVGLDVGLPVGQTLGPWLG